MLQNAFGTAHHAVTCNAIGDTESQTGALLEAYDGVEGEVLMRISAAISYHATAHHAIRPHTQSTHHTAPYHAIPYHTAPHRMGLYIAVQHRNQSLWLFFLIEGFAV